MRKALIGLATFVLGLVAAFSYAQAPVPLINQPLVPDAVAPGSAAFTLTVNGTGFVSNSTVDWNGTALTTTFVSQSRLTASVPASDIATASTASVTVMNPSPGGGTSNIAFLSITIPSSTLVFSSSNLSSGASGADSVATGDFNGDGKVDLAVANDNDPGSVGVLLSNGDGTFQREVSYATDAYADTVVVGDFNRDGRLDLAVRSQYSFTVSVLLGNGDGTFQPYMTTPTSACQGRLAEGDFNGDGKLDLACTSSSANNVAILLGNGDGTFEDEVDYPAGSGADAIAIGDFNGDGKLDLAITDTVAPGGVSILLGNGGGTFQSPVEYATPNLPTDAVNAADFNGDGILDLAVPIENSAVSIFLGNGDGTFKSPESFPTGQSNNRSAVADLNGDGKPDLAITEVDFGQISILLGNGDGTFQAPLELSGSSPLGVAAADFNGDGRLDLAVADFGRSTISVLLQLTGPPLVVLSPTSLGFGTQLIGTRSAPQTVTLTNGGAETLDITSIAASANFVQNNNCGSSVAGGASCTLTVGLHPLDIGALTGTVTITDNASNSPQTVSLTGTGTFVTLSPGSLNFGSQAVGTTSAAQTVTLTNHSYRTVSISLIQFLPPDAGDFAQTNTCGTSVAAQASCTISVTFTPQAQGSRKSAMVVIDNGGGSPQKVRLSGTGT